MVGVLFLQRIKKGCLNLFNVVPDYNFTEYSQHPTHPATGSFKVRLMKVSGIWPAGRGNE